MASRLHKRLVGLKIKPLVAEKLTRMDWNDRVTVTMRVLRRLVVDKDIKPLASSIKEHSRVVAEMSFDCESDRDAEEEIFRMSFATNLINTIKNNSESSPPISPKKYIRLSAASDVMNFLHWMMDAIEARRAKGQDMVALYALQQQKENDLQRQKTMFEESEKKVAEKKRVKSSTSMKKEQRMKLEKAWDNSSISSTSNNAKHGVDTENISISPSSTNANRVLDSLLPSISGECIQCFHHKQRASLLQLQNYNLQQQIRHLQSILLRRASSMETIHNVLETIYSNNDYNHQQKQHGNDTNHLHLPSSSSRTSMHHLSREPVKRVGSGGGSQKKKIPSSKQSSHSRSSILSHATPTMKVGKEDDVKRHPSLSLNVPVKEDVDNHDHNNEYMPDRKRSTSGKITTSAKTIQQLVRAVEDVKYVNNVIEDGRQYLPWESTTSLLKYQISPSSYSNVNKRTSKPEVENDKAVDLGKRKFLHDSSNSLNIVDTCSGNLSHLNLQHVSRLEEELIETHDLLVRAGGVLACVCGSVGKTHDTILVDCVEKLYGTADHLLQLSILIPAAPQPKLAIVSSLFERERGETWKDALPSSIYDTSEFSEKHPVVIPTPSHFINETSSLNKKMYKEFITNFLWTCALHCNRASVKADTLSTSNSILSSTIEAYESACLEALQSVGNLAKDLVIDLRKRIALPLRDLVPEISNSHAVSSESTSSILSQVHQIVDTLLERENQIDTFSVSLQTRVSEIIASQQHHEYMLDRFRFLSSSFQQQDIG
eukprot:m.92090 g.92090  ORF g.92090 m.92090 type:complete len:770 (+) comp8884_c2_seq8:361-2670(+)